MLRLSRRAVLTALLMAPVADGAATLSNVEAADPARQVEGRLLDVPYVPQSVDLCGGAALAMVLRYWGDRSAIAEDFAGLVDPDEGGIRTGRLVQAARERGWEAVPMAGADADLVRSHVARGRPAIALIEERRGVLHYVVIVAWTATNVIVHDPARAPFRTFTLEEFARRWAATDRWFLLVLPLSGPTTDEPPERNAAPTEAPPEPCQGLLTRGVHLAGAGDLAAAEQTLAAATAECPARPAAWRELAGVHFLRQQWPDAERAAARAVDLAPGDEHGWRVLAAARYQQADWVGALRAMRATGEPPIDLIEVSGAARTPHPVVIDVTGLSSRMPMTASAFERAARRLADLPIATRSRLTYRPTGSGSMTVEAAVAERDAWPRRWTALAGVAARAAADQTVRIDLGGLARSGELATALWRWSPGRPMAGIRLATPAPARLPGIAVVEGTWEWQTDRPPADGEITQESRKRVGLLLTDWASGSVRWEAEAALERFNARQHAAAGGAIEVHGLADRLAVRTEAAGWAGRDAARFSTGSIELAARSGSSGTSRPWLAARAGLAFASTAAPLALWPGADTGMAGAALLRAHPLPDDGVLSGAVFGRHLWHATLEYGHPLFRHPAADVAVIGFADAARARRGRAHVGVAPPGTHVDLGAGVRVATPGMRGSLDINVAYGTRDGRVVLSAGVGTPWPSFDGWRDR